jgi:hypothetical protein
VSEKIDWKGLEKPLPHMTRNATAPPETITYADAPMPEPKRIPTYYEDVANEEAKVSKTERLMQFAQGVFDRCLALSRRKNADYAGEEDPLKNFRRHGAYGVAVRLDDKICRLGTLLDPKKSDGPAVKDESIEDTCLDVINYAWILMRLRQEEKEVHAASVPVTPKL